MLTDVQTAFLGTPLVPLKGKGKRGRDGRADGRVARERQPETTGDSQRQREKRGAKGRRKAGRDRAESRQREGGEKAESRQRAGGEKAKRRQREGRWKAERRQK